MESTAPSISSLSDTSSELSVIKSLLLHRLRLIGDKKLRESNPATQLALLQQVSENIQQWHLLHRQTMPARLNHFLLQASFQKALDFINQTTAITPPTET